MSPGAWRRYARSHAPERPRDTVWVLLLDEGPRARVRGEADHGRVPGPIGSDHARSSRHAGSHARRRVELAGATQRKPEAEWKKELAATDYPRAAALIDHWRRDEQEMRAWLATLDDETLQQIHDLEPGSTPKERFPLWYYVLHMHAHTQQQLSDAAVLLTRMRQSPGISTSSTTPITSTSERPRTDTHERAVEGNMAVVTTRTLDAAAVTEAAAAIGPHIRRTPTEKSDALSGLAGREVYLKLENLQKTGSFKIRGGLNALMQMDERRRANGVVTASAGNHGQGVAFAAKLLGVPACVVLPDRGAACEAHGDPADRRRDRADGRELRRGARRRARDRA